MSKDINQILSPIEAQIKRHQALLEETLATDSEFIFQITDHLFSRTGKRLRPGLIFLSAGHSDKPALVYASVAIELIHVATLLHDDVIDQSDKRRGIETVNHRWNNLVSVLMGDYLFAKSFKLLVDSGSTKLLDRFSQATQRVSIGELNQVYATGNFDLAENTYINIIADKTAALFACACEAGAICNGGDEIKEKALREFGENLGIAFQITDDLLDIIGESTKTGKQLGSDIREGWTTLPLIYALRNGGNYYKDQLVKLYKQGFSQGEFDNVVKFVREAGGIDYADTQARKYSERAKEAVAGISGLDYKENLIQLADFAVAREK
ncbi:MAG: polyprenyl synthetase family protein [candidate division Zixibacteria bacterium]|nr:polyprenyl synthetase family protein [candidate division Zixibacteria bacterium]